MSAAGGLCLTCSRVALQQAHTRLAGSLEAIQAKRICACCSASLLQVKQNPLQLTRRQVVKTDALRLTRRAAGTGLSPERASPMVWSSIKAKAGPAKADSGRGPPVQPAPSRQAEQQQGPVRLESLAGNPRQAQDQQPQQPPAAAGSSNGVHSAMPNGFGHHRAMPSPSAPPWVSLALWCMACPPHSCLGTLVCAAAGSSNGAHSAMPNGFGHHMSIPSPFAPPWVSLALRCIACTCRPHCLHFCLGTLVCAAAAAAATVPMQRCPTALRISGPCPARQRPPG